MTWAVWETINENVSPLIQRLGPTERMELFRGRGLRLKAPTLVGEQPTQALTLYETAQLAGTEFPNQARYQEGVVVALHLHRSPDH